MIPKQWICSSFKWCARLQGVAARRGRRTGIRQDGDPQIDDGGTLDVDSMPTVANVDPAGDGRPLPPGAIGDGRIAEVKKRDYGMRRTSALHARVDV